MGTATATATAKRGVRVGGAANLNPAPTVADGERRRGNPLGPHLIVIESRWASTPLAFAGQLPPRRLNV